MSDYLDSLAARALNLAQPLRPRLTSLYEPSPAIHAGHLDSFGEVLTGVTPVPFPDHTSDLETIFTETEFESNLPESIVAPHFHSPPHQPDPITPEESSDLESFSRSPSINIPAPTDWDANQPHSIPPGTSVAAESKLSQPFQTVADVPPSEEKREVKVQPEILRPLPDNLSLLGNTVIPPHQHFLENSDLAGLPGEIKNHPVFSDHSQTFRPGDGSAPTSINPGAGLKLPGLARSNQPEPTILEIAGQELRPATLRPGEPAQEDIARQTEPEPFRPSRPFNFTGPDLKVSLLTPKLPEPAERLREGADDFERLAAQLDSWRSKGPVSESKPAERFMVLLEPFIGSVEPDPVLPLSETSTTREVTPPNQNISITIGRIEIRATPFLAAPVSPRPARPSIMSLADYLQQRRGGNP